MAGGHQRSDICRIVCGHDAGPHPFSILGGVAARRLALPEASLDSVDVSLAEAEFPMAFWVSIAAERWFQWGDQPLGPSGLRRWRLLLECPLDLGAHGFSF